MRLPKEVDKPTYEIVSPVERYDQRDSATSRSLMQEGTPDYEEYYSRHPELKEWDTENRRLRTKARKANLQRDPVNEQFSSATFFSRGIMGIHALVYGTYWRPSGPEPGTEKVDVDPVEMAKKVKAFGKYLGADKVRIAELNQDWVYTNYAHPYTEEPYGKPVDLDYKYIICLAIRQDPAMTANGIGVASCTEVGWKYAFASFISVTLAHFIRSLGWRARALPTADSPYLVVPAFVDAGIGEQGRCTYVVTKEFGNNFRPGAVATDMPLAVDKPVDFGLQDFCSKCTVCADNCPVGALSSGEKQVVRGVRRWAFADGEKCRRLWDQTAQPGCCICQTICPWDHPDTWYHNTVRELAVRFPFLRKTLINAEKKIYGRFKAQPPPEWMRTKGTKE